MPSKKEVADSLDVMQTRCGKILMMIEEGSIEPKDLSGYVVASIGLLANIQAIIMHDCFEE